MKSQDTPFEGGPMDGRVLPVLLGPTGHPPKIYRIPVPAPDGGEPTVLVYRREARAHSRRLGTPQGWKYAYDPGADPRSGTLRLPWSRRNGPARGRPGATPSGNLDDTEG